MRWPQGIFYGWSMVAVAALLIAFGEWQLWDGLEHWHRELKYSFDWTAGQTSWAVSLAQAVLLMAPVAGLLVDRLGPRRAVFIGLLVLGAGFVLFSQIRELWHLFLASIVISMGSLMSSLLPAMTVLNSWFTRRKTLSMALALTLGGLLSGIFMLVLLAWVIGDSGTDIPQRFGWRTTALLAGLVYLALAFPLSRLVRNKPEDMELLPDGDVQPPTAWAQGAIGGSPMPEADWGYSWREAARTKNFWLMFIGNAAALVTLTAMFAHLGLFLDDRGYSLQMVSVAVAIITLSAAVFLLVGGHLGDKFSMRKVAFGFSASLALSVLLLVLASGTGMLLVFAVLFGMGSGGPIAIKFSMRGRYFGRKAFATITGLSISLAIIPIAVGSVVAGIVRDSTGNYDAAFLALAAITLVGGLAFLIMGEPPPQRHGLHVADQPLERAPAEQPIP